MCGILASFNSKISNDEFKRSLKLLQNRGPDNMNFFEEFNNKFGHTRLSIIDTIEESNQPFVSNNQRYLITYNGEIFNYKELKEKYKLKCRTNSDTEVILELYIKYGPEIIKILNGMFAFIIYDKQNKDYFIGRDRYGIKPLYWIFHKGGIIYSSEIRALISIKGKVEFDDVSIRQYKKLRGFHIPNTLYKEIFEFPPGSYNINGKESKYWEFTPSNEEEFDQLNFNDLFKQSIMESTISDVGYDCFLSGGLDSSLIASITNPSKCWTIGEPNLNNEFQYSQLVSSNLNQDLVKINYDKESFIKNTNEIIEKRKDVLTVPNETLIYMMSKRIRSNKTKVILCGEGADELFLGYDRIFGYFSNNKFDISKFDKLYSYSKGDVEILEEIFKDIKDNPLNIVRKFFFNFHIKGLLKRVDSMTMLNGIEARVPFLNNNIVDYIERLRPEYLITKNEPKKILKDYASNCTNLPKDIIYRKKVGFPVQLENIFNDNSLNKNLSGYEKWFKFNLDTLRNFI